MNNLIDSLVARGYSVTHVADKDAAREYILGAVNKEATIGIGGSMTIKDTGVGEALVDRGNTVYWHWKVDSNQMDVCRKALVSDVYLCSANAITEDGVIVNIDGNGNRVAATIFGPQKVIMLIGINKITPDIHGALKRAKEVACPKNAKRLGLKTPCAETGICTDCHSPSRMCKATSILEGKTGGIPDFEIVLIEEELGF